MSGNLYSLFVRRRRNRDRPFIETPDARVLRYAEAFELAGRLAKALVDAGVEPGDRVAVQVEKSPEAIVLYLACLKAGAVYLPLNTAYTLAEVEYFIADAEPRVFVTTPERQAALEPLANRLGVAAVETLGTSRGGSLLERAAHFAPAGPAVPRKNDDLAAILYTSGTTGRSKGAMLTHGNLASNAEVLMETWRFSATDVLLHALPIFHTHGLFVATNVTLLAGSSMLFLPRFDVNEILRLLPRATVMMGVPTFYTRLLEDERLSRETTSGMRLFIAGSAPLLAETHREWQRRTGHAILERYGMTETGMITSNPYDGERVPGSVGQALTGVEVRIVKADTGAPTARGEIGMIEVRGPNVFKGYWRMPEKTAAEFHGDGFFKTGDMGMQDPEGYISIVGRDKDVVISGGFNVYPKEIETEIDAIPGVVESAVIGVPHPDFGEGVTAAVVKSAGAPVDEATVIGRLEGRLAKYKLPKRVVFVGALPRNSMGKVLKNELRDTYRNLYAASAGAESRHSGISTTREKKRG